MKESPSLDGDYVKKEKTRVSPKNFAFIYQKNSLEVVAASV